MSSGINFTEEAIVAAIMAQLDQAQQSSRMLLQGHLAQVVIELDIIGPGQVHFNLMSGTVSVPRQGNVTVFLSNDMMQRLEHALQQVVQALVNDFIQSAMNVSSSSTARFFQLPQQEKQYAQRLAATLQTLASENIAITSLDQVRELMRAVQETSTQSLQKTGNQK
jgi:hypothetical protein